MTGTEAEAVIRTIWEGPKELDRERHFSESAGRRGYSMQDVSKILRSHRLERAPEWKPEYGAYRVRLLGTCLEGRSTRLVLDLRTDGPCVLVSIMTNTQIDRKRRRR